MLTSPLEEVNSAATVGRASKAAAAALYGKVLLTQAADEDFAADSEALVDKACEKLTYAWETRSFESLTEIDYASLWNLDSQKTARSISSRSTT